MNKQFTEEQIQMAIDIRNDAQGGPKCNPRSQLVLARGRQWIPGEVQHESLLPHLHRLGSGHFIQQSLTTHLLQTRCSARYLCAYLFSKSRQRSYPSPIKIQNIFISPEKFLTLLPSLSLPQTFILISIIKDQFCLLENFT